MKKLVLMFLLVMMSAPAWAANVPAHEDIVIKVNGMVCDFCAQSVWKVFKKYDDVDQVEISLDDGTVTVHMKPGRTLGNEELDKAITYAGYELVGVERQEDAQHPAIMSDISE
ncbi:MAG: cation transporter [Alphaproteobacteria bacterium]|nr:cation transporter [Alphaproteobacteria bacterium]